MNQPNRKRPVSKGFAAAAHGLTGCSMPVHLDSVDRGDKRYNSAKPWCRILALDSDVIPLISSTITS